MASWFFPIISEKISSLRTHFENIYANFTKEKGHSTHPFLSEEEWKSFKSSPDVLKTLDEVGKKKFADMIEKYTNKGNKNISPSEDKQELRIVLTGKTGVGKSATGNTILGEEQFEEGSSAKSVTSKSTKKFREINGRLISVIDTPGLHDTHRSKEDIAEEIARVMKIFSKGIHAFIYVHDISSPRFTDENKKTLELIEELFGGGIKTFRLLVYSKAETLGNSNLDQFCKEQMKDDTQEISEFLRDLDWRVVAVNNKTTVPAEKKRNQEIIIAMVDKLKEHNKNAVYTNEMFHEAVKKRKELEEKGKREKWNPDVMEAVDAVVAANPDASKEKCKLVENVNKHLEEKLRKVEKELSEIKEQKNEEEMLRILQNQEDKREAIETLEHEYEQNRMRWESEKEEQERKHRMEKEQMEKMLSEKHEQLLKERHEKLQRKQKELFEREISAQQTMEEEGAYAREEGHKGGSREQNARQRTEEQLRKLNEEKQERAHAQEETQRATQKKTNEDNEETLEGESLEQIKMELQEIIEKERKEKGMLLEKQAEERERARKEREELIKENELRLQLTKDAIDCANKTMQVTEIAKEHDDIVTSMVGVVTSNLTNWATSGVSSLYNYGKSWMGY